MFHEYGVDPDCLDEYHRFQYLTEGFGFSQGRLIARFPKDWARRVDQACKEFSFRERQLMADELVRLKKFALVPSGRTYDGDMSWKNNAVTQHRTKPFHAIITTDNDAGLDFVLEAGNINRTTPLWRVPKERRIDRTAEALAAAISPLLRVSNRVVFIDKHFRPEVPRWRRGLQAFLELATVGRTQVPSVEYHQGIHIDDLLLDDPIRTQTFESECQLHLSPCIPEGVALKLFRWNDDNPGDEQMHARYILTERGGVRIDFGLDTSWRGRTDVSLLDEDFLSESLSMYSEDSEVFELIDIVTVVGRG